MTHMYICFYNLQMEYTLAMYHYIRLHHAPFYETIQIDQQCLRSY